MPTLCLLVLTWTRPLLPYHTSHGFGCRCNIWIICLRFCSITQALASVIVEVLVVHVSAGLVAGSLVANSYIIKSQNMVLLLRS